MRRLSRSDSGESPFLKEGAPKGREIECAARRITSCESKESSWAQKASCLLGDTAEIVPLRATLSSGALRYLISKEGLTGVASDDDLIKSREAHSLFPHLYLANGIAPNAPQSETRKGHAPHLPSLSEFSLSSQTPQKAKKENSHASHLDIHRKRRSLCKTMRPWETKGTTQYFTSGTIPSVSGHRRASSATRASWNGIMATSSSWPSIKISEKWKNTSI